MEEILTVNGKDFLLVQRIPYNLETYLYLISTDDEEDLLMLKEDVKEKETTYQNVTDEELIKNILQNMN